MPTQQLSLNGEWTVRGEDPEGSGDPIALTGRVPGHIHCDLLAAGRIPDPFWRDQADACQWVEHWRWTYTRTFDVPKGFVTGWERLEFDGLDTFATIRLNGREVGTTANMFVPHALDVTGVLREGTNELEVTFTPHHIALADKPSGKYVSCFSDDRVFARKMQCGFGWDWVHRLVSMGIWQSVRVVAHDRARLADVFVSTAGIERERAEMRLEIEAERQGEEPLTAEIAITDPAGRTVATETASLGTSAAETLSLGVDAPELWWPAGHGEQPLYGCRVMLRAADGTALDERTVQFGIRTVTVDETRDAHGSRCVFIINGRRIFCKGGNWVPADPFPSQVTPERYDRLIRLVRDGNMNMLRTWGGGIYEPAPFWDACNRYGVMIMQDFLLACAQYPEEDAAFMAALREEFGKAIRMLRNHPSLVLWSGDNEVGMNSDPSGPYPGKRVAEEITGPLLAELDPTRPYWMTSPHDGSINNDPMWGDCHLSAWYNADFFASDMHDYRERISETWGRFLSESCVPGTPPLRSMLKFMTLEDLADPERRLLEYHTKSNPYSGVKMTHSEMLERTALNVYGETTDVETRNRRMEYIQCEWMQLTGEALRRRAFDCGGVLYWMYNDCWPASGWSMVDYYGFPKAGYYGAKRGFRPVIAGIEPGASALRIWVCNDGPHTANVRLRVRFQPWRGDAAWTRTYDVAATAGSAQQACEVARTELGADGMLVCDLVWEGGEGRTVHYAGVVKEMAPPPTRLRVEQEGDGVCGTVTITTEHYARVVSLDADLDFSDSYFDLMPGETRTIAWRCPEGRFDGEIPVSCWNQAPSA